MHALMGEIEEANGNLDAAIAHYGHAVGFQDNLNYTEPPDWSQSMRLYQGAALIQAGKPRKPRKSISRIYSGISRMAGLPSVCIRHWKLRAKIRRLWLSSGSLNRSGAMQMWS